MTMLRIAGTSSDDLGPWAGPPVESQSTDILTDVCTIDRAMPLCEPISAY